MFFDCNSSIYLPKEEVQEILQNNVNLMETMKNEQMHLFNESIMLTNMLNEQKKEIGRLERNNAEKEAKVKEAVKRLEEKKGMKTKLRVVDSKVKDVLSGMDNVRELKQIHKRIMISSGIATQRPLRRNQTLDLIKRPSGLLNKTLQDDVQQQETMVEDIDEKKLVVLENMNEDELKNLFESFSGRSAESIQLMQKLRNDISTANSNLHLFLRNTENKMNEVFTCKNCFQKFTLMHNNEKNCVSHPGKIKFFSCSKCGSDEYYTCCRECGECSKGCKQSYHAAFTSNYASPTNSNMRLKPS